MDFPLHPLLIPLHPLLILRNISLSGGEGVRIVKGGVGGGDIRV